MEAKCGIESRKVAKIVFFFSKKFVVIFLSFSSNDSEWATNNFSIEIDSAVNRENLIKDEIKNLIKDEIKNEVSC